MALDMTNIFRELSRAELESLVMDYFASKEVGVRPELFQTHVAILKARYKVDYPNASKMTVDAFLDECTRRFMEGE